MKISISGSQNSGKTTLISHFMRHWPMYKNSEKTYRDIIKENNLTHSSSTTAETQLLILDWMTKTLKENKNEKYFIYDRCPLDNLVYTLHANERNLISDEITAATIDIVKASLKDLDIIFWLKYDSSIKVVKDGLRDTDIKFIKEIDELFVGLYEQYTDHLENTPFFIAEDCPAIIPIEGLSIDDRIAWIGEFIDTKGDLIETTDSVLDPKNLDMLEQMLKEQGTWVEKDNQFKNLAKEIKNFKI
jgi:adenylate kinase family enzyme